MARRGNSASRYVAEIELSAAHVGCYKEEAIVKRSLFSVVSLLGLLAIARPCVLAQQSYDPAKAKAYIERSSVISDLYAARHVVEKGDLLPLKYVFNDLQLASLDITRLRILRNTIFAQYGYVFKSADLDRHFRMFSWYNPSRTNVDRFLTDVDKYNVALVRLYEQLQATPSTSVPQQKDLIGAWHPMPIVAAGWMQRLFFYPDGNFVYTKNQMDPTDRLLRLTGKWRLADGRLIVDVSTQTYLEGGHAGPPGLDATEYAISDGKRTLSQISPVLTLTLPLSYFIPADNAQGRLDYSLPSVEIGKTKYWKMFDDPKEAEGYE